MGVSISLKSFFLKRWSLIFLFLLLIFFSITGKGFFSIENFQDIFLASTSIMLLGIGVTFVIITGGIDLSVGFTMGLTSVVMASTIKDLIAINILPTISILLSFIPTLLIGIITGLINGYIVAYLRVPSEYHHLLLHWVCMELHMVLP